MQGSYKGVWVCLLVISLISSLVTCGMATKKAKLLGPPRGFVQASGTIFTIDGKPWFCAGTNQFGVALIDRLSDNEVKELFRIHRERGANVIRVFAHSDGYGFPREMQVAEPIQPELGQYNEKALRRLDLVLAEARKNNIKLILPFTNYEPFLGGIQWYAEQVHGRGADKELFFTDSTIRNYYKKYVSMLLKRRNTITGTKYRDDPTVMAWELMNEPHTRDDYEKKKGIKPGTIVNKWIKEMAAFIKSIDPNHMLITGEEGYRSQGPQLTENNGRHDWINNGLKGVEFKDNTAVSNIDAATVHAYPDNWGFTSSNYRNYGRLFMQDRAKIARELNKPIIMEEYGMNQGWLPSRNTLLNYLQDEAKQAGFACALVWQVNALAKDGKWGYNFQYGDDGWSALKSFYSYTAGKNGGSTPNPPPGCSDTPPPPGEHSCAQQKRWGKCGESWMRGYCKASCGTCATQALAAADAVLPTPASNDTASAASAPRVDVEIDVDAPEDAIVDVDVDIIISKLEELRLPEEKDLFMIPENSSTTTTASGPAVEKAAAPNSFDADGFEDSEDQFWSSEEMDLFFVPPVAGVAPAPAP